MMYNKKEAFKQIEKNFTREEADLIKRLIEKQEKIAILKDEIVKQGEATLDNINELAKKWITTSIIKVNKKSHEVLWYYNEGKRYNKNNVIYSITEDRFLSAKEIEAIFI